jgi:NAD(P)-dependent dehydrogenase (short-subunit alcohol dehydrogenase family)
VSRSNPAIRGCHLYHKQFDLNVLGLVLTSQEAAKHFGPAGAGIVNVSSLASTFTPANASVYSATKAAVDAVTKSLVKELGPRNIRMNAINFRHGRNGGHACRRLRQKRFPQAA